MGMQCRGFVVRSDAVREAGVVFVLSIEGEEQTWPCLFNHDDDRVRNDGLAKLAELCLGCGVATVFDTDELNGKSFTAKLSDFGEVRGFVNATDITPSAKPRRFGAVRRLWEDFVEAPISGAAVGVSIVAALTAMIRGNIELAFLIIISGQITALSRELSK